MPDILAPLAQSLVSSAILFFVFFLVLGAVFAQGKIVYFVVGFFKVLFSVLYSPFVYLRRAVQAVCRFAERGEADYKGNEQYLLTKFFLTAQAAVVLFALATAAAGCVAAWMAFLPPKAIRDQLEETRGYLKQRKAELRATTDNVALLKKEWLSKREAEIQKAKGRLDEVIQKYAEERTMREVALKGDPLAWSQLTAIKDFVVRTGVPSTPEVFSEMQVRIEQRVAAVPLEYYSAQALRQWIRAWEREVGIRFQQKNIDEEALRAEVQPEFRQALDQEARLTSEVAQLERNVEEIKAEAKVRPGAGLRTLLLTLATLLAYLWVAGICLEAAALAVRVAEDVRRVREGLVPERAVVGTPPPLVPSRIPENY